MIEIYLEGDLEPVRAAEPIQATFMNMSAAMNNNTHFFMCKNSAGEVIAVNINKITKIREIGASDD